MAGPDPIRAARPRWSASTVEADKREEFGARPRVRAERAKERGRDGLGTDRLDATQRHAKMLGLDHHADAGRRQLCLQPVRHLLGEPLLYLRPMGEMLDDTSELRKTEDALARQVAHMRNAHEGQQMMFADRADRKRTSEHEFVVPLIVG